MSFWVRFAKVQGGFCTPSTGSICDPFGDGSTSDFTVALLEVKGIGFEQFVGKITGRADGVGRIARTVDQPAGNAPTVAKSRTSPSNLGKKLGIAVFLL